jgi:phage gp36-like protein
MIGTNTLDVTTVDIASVYIADAESIVNGYLARRYTMPLTAEPLLTDLTADIALYRLLEDKVPRIPDFMDKRYTNAMSLLTQLRDGGMVLTSTNLASSGANSDQFAWSNVVDPDFQGTVFKPIEAQTLCLINSPSGLDFG